MRVTGVTTRCKRPHGGGRDDPRGRVATRGTVRSAAGAALGLGVAVTLLTTAGALAATIPVKRCPSTYGVPQAAPPIPAAISVPIAHALVALLTGYSNGALTLVAPSDWICRGQVGADGSGGTTIHPRGHSGRDAPQITGLSAFTPGVAADLACGFFAAATAQLPVRPCLNHRPRRERREALSRHVVPFQDPAGVRGSGVPSGGRYAAFGAVLFQAQGSRSDTYAGKVTCAVPAVERRLCTPAAVGFVAANGPGSIRRRG